MTPDAQARALKPKRYTVDGCETGSDFWLLDDEKPIGIIGKTTRDTINLIVDSLNARPTWTDERPTVPGWYWWRDEMYYQGSPDICRVVESSVDGMLMCYWAAQRDRINALISIDSGQWARIEMPEAKP